MEYNRNSFTNMLNSPLSPNENPSSQDTPNPNFSQQQNFHNPNFSQNPNFCHNLNFSHNPNYPFNPNMPMNRNFSFNANFPMTSNFWPNQSSPANYPPFMQTPNIPHPRNPSPIDLTGDGAEPCEAPVRRMWSEKEDIRLMAAYLTVSNDPIVGNDQKAETFWQRIATYFNENGDGAEERSWQMCKAHYHKLSAAVSKFSTIYNALVMQRPSGASDDQLMEEARKVYKNDVKKNFNLVHVWRMVKEEPKWKGQSGFSSSYQSKKKSRINEAGDYSSSPQPETPHSQQESTNEPQMSQPGLSPPEPIDEEPSQPRSRPIGQKAAKRKGKGKGKVGQSSRDSYDSEQSAQVEALTNLHQEMTLEFKSFNRSNEKVAMELERQNRIKERKEKEQAMWKYNALLNKDTSGMTAKALQMHENMLNFYRQEYGWD